jgi:hypothetical protein
MKEKIICCGEGYHSYQLSGIVERLHRERTREQEERGNGVLPINTR